MSDAKRFEITQQVLSVDEVVGRVADPGNGAIVTFIGVVRDNTAGRQVTYLEYEAYSQMAEETLRQIAEEIRARWTTVRDVAIVHRVGRMFIGEISVVIVLSAGHRPELYDALHFAIDRLKGIVPIWKKEVWADGSEWRSEHD